MTARNWNVDIRGQSMTVWVEEGPDGQPIKVEARIGKLGSPFGHWVAMVCDAVSAGQDRDTGLQVDRDGLRRTAGDPGSEAVDAVARLLEENYPVTGGGT